MIITITGTPGVGKTTLARKIAKQLSIAHVDLNKYIKDHRLYSSYDRKNKCYIVDQKKLAKLTLFDKYKGEDAKKKDNPANPPNFNTFQSLMVFLKKMSQKHRGESSIIIDSHLSQYIKSDVCIVVRSAAKKIQKRLLARGYVRKKIQDNIDAEIFGFCLEEARALHRNIIVFNN